LIRQDIFVSQRANSILEKFYDFKIENFNFEDSKNLKQEVNKWVTELTNGKITSLIDREPSTDTVMMLINAVYFRGLWQIPFNHTITKDFFVEASSGVAKEFVQQTSDFYYVYSKDLEAKIVRLPYEGGRFSMFVLLPFDVDGLTKLVEKLNAEKINAEIGKMELYEVNVTLPKFKFDSELKLKSVLQAVSRSCDGNLKRF
jgi:serine protease inhibitor